MKLRLSLWFVLLGLVSFPLYADQVDAATSKDTQKIIQNNFVETANKGIKLSGYVDTGYSYNFNSSKQSEVIGRFSGDTASRGDFNLYAVKIALEKAMTSENKAQAGFRADVMIGEDAYYLQNRNSGTAENNTSQNSNSLFLEQAYTSIRAPVGNGLDFKVGKFVSILGYEVIERPANMNITYGLLWQQFPLYYTGILASYRFDEYLDMKLGVVNGSNTDNNTTTGLNGDGCALIASLDVTAPGANANWSNNFQWSTNPENNSSWEDPSLSSIPTDVQNYNPNSNGYALIYNSWGNWSPKFANDKLLFAFNTVLGTAKTSPANEWWASDGGAYSTTWWGAGAYAKYQFNDWFSLSSRGEFLGGSNDLKVASYNGNEAEAPSYWEYTLTAGFNVIDNLLIRAEYRLDWGNQSNGTPISSPEAFGPSGGIAAPVLYEPTGSGPSHYAGVEVVYSF